MIVCACTDVKRAKANTPKAPRRMVVLRFMIKVFSNCSSNIAETLRKKALTARRNRRKKPPGHITRIARPVLSDVEEKEKAPNDGVRGLLLSGGLALKFVFVRGISRYYSSQGSPKLIRNSSKSAVVVAPSRFKSVGHAL